MDDFDMETMRFFEERYRSAVERLAELNRELTGKEDAVSQYFFVLSEQAMKMSGIYEPAKNGDLLLQSEKNLAEFNEKIYAECLPENYATSFLNPEYAVKKLGSKAGKPASALFYMMIKEIPSAYFGRTWELCVLFELVLEIYGIMKDDPENSAAIRRAIYYYHHDYCMDFQKLSRKRFALPSANSYIALLDNADIKDPAFLYLYGEYVTDYELGVFDYVNKLPEEKVDSIADTFVGGYVRGFEAAGIDFSERKIIEIRYSPGFERIIKRAVEKFREMGKEVVLYLYHFSANRQCDYDHRNDKVLWLDEKYKNLSAEALEAACREVKEALAVYAGPACLEAFGEPDFTPANSEYALSPSENERRLMTEMQSDRSQILCKYIDMSKRSFTIMSLPLPSITIGREDLAYEEIFDEIIRVNTLDNDKYRKLQQKIIDILDSGEYVHVKGKGSNKTDIRVMLHHLSDPAHETNFENCTADVNIPVGEVFTSPVLSGTNGTLNVSRAFLNGFEFKNLCIEFENGMIKDYSCKNFDDESENREYIREKILYNHDSLPIGEFAIGTNTTAYALAERLDIWDKLPILIAEKTGPHFAVGDTCYSDMEDMMTYNPDGKAIIARDNEISILRKEDRSKAYFNCHTDITIPYDELEFIRVAGKGEGTSASGKTESIIENGRFVFPGAEELNKALEGK